MWLWLKRLAAWLRRTILCPFDRIGEPQLRAVSFRYEKAGVSVRQEPIPWNADAVVVEALVQFPGEEAGPKGDFFLRVPGDVPSMAVALQPAEAAGVFRVVFRLPPLRKATAVRLYWRTRRLAQVELPYLSAEDFLGNLRLESPMVFARLGQWTVACQTLVQGQCGGVTSCGMLKSTTSLLPVIDLGVTVTWTNQGTGQSHTVAVPLNGSQVVARQTLLSGIPQWRSWAVGCWSVRWAVAGRTLAGGSLRVVSGQTFEQSLYLADGRFLDADAGGASLLAPQSPLPEAAGPRPCFLIASREAGMAGLCRVAVAVHLKDGARVPGPDEQEVLVLDVPSPFVPPGLPVEDADRISAFELFSSGRLLGTVCSHPTPVATFTTEGGFVAAEEYTWTAIAEAELEEQLTKLMRVPPEW